MEEQEDGIGLLPDCLLGTIVSMLPPKAAARTMLLSRRWRRIWPSLPLDLQRNADSDAPFLTAESINSVLSSHRGPIRRFCVTTLDGVGTCAWLRALAERRVDDTLIVRWACRFQHPVPRTLLGKAAVSIRHLDLHCCRLGPPNVLHSPVPTLPNLDYLYLSDVIISEAALHRMIEVCPVLRELHLFMIHGLHRVCFRSCTLTTMSMSTPCVPLDEFSVRDTPALQSITFTHIDLWRIPNFAVNFGKPRVAFFLKRGDSPASASGRCIRTTTPSRMFLSGMKAVWVGCTTACAISLPFVTSLVFGMKFTNGEELTKAIHLLTLFTCLQRLEILCFYFGPNNEAGCGDWKPASEMVIWQSKHLTHVRLSGYSGTVGEVDFARYLMVRTQSLRAMDISHSVDWTPKDISRQTELICLQGKASPLAELFFTRSAQPDDVRRKVARYLHTLPML
ncbi:putative F-box/LRR-repeat protein At3g59230 [Aegilops tauschii subsp. strangulata]|uniref:putative F-box/LRR-repeat protein At3g59230 n=1 Tax=Aegilops tauschii subsp. strangulata TaxID=200361 RepID=UPI001ABC8330|nr:F-box/LRR-repeat protein At3g59190-like [Aegilops tauschii subsp. strangulata]